MTEEERCRQTAQNRLKDALVLYQEERYEATLYMCGYVIEIGIKAEFHRLANTMLSSVDDKAGSIINHLFKDYSEQEFMNNFRFPTTIFEFTKLLSDISSFINDTKGKKVFNNLSTFGLILTNRLPSTNSHNTSEFLKSLNEWKVAIGEPSFSIENYKIDDTLNWGTHLRYGESGFNIIEDEQQNSKQALQMAIDFLKNVVFKNDDIALIDMNQYQADLDNMTQ